ncbi:ATP-binding protein [Leadbettera azotonutricia]|uniref:ATPase n=1 Tax=Leadbettera azotonutricia (strain ATCC BAA-888 / DSM 13862 / ZAS-9) TaxID=545695 RepID=F5YDN5_LEAAZ|nr:ATP-binding protein [Leadbettera azotonutricia]AEF80302.1 ATPase [Leadbettera azotonutricia ZAS-9]
MANKVPLIQRREYLDVLIGFRDKRLIKIVTGIRRCGKSTLFELYQDYLRRHGARGQIIAINFENPDFEELRDWKKLYNHIKKRLIPGKMNYVFLDEIQSVPEYQKAADGLYIKKNVDLYLTGSNAYMLSGEIATLLSGRYIEVQMLPLSFKEFVSASGGNESLPRLYNRYLTESSFPYALELNGDRKRINEYLEGIYNTILNKDVIARKKVADPLMLESVLRFMFFNIGNLTSTTNIANTMKSQGRSISVHTVESYLALLRDSYILYRVGRYDIKGKQYLQSGDKYYTADMGLRYFLLGTKNANLGSMLENIIYLELIRRGKRIYVGKAGVQEIDFITDIPGGGTEYYQVSLSVRSADVLARELEPFGKAKDHNPKYLLTLDDDPEVSHNGIRQLYALDWLLGKV